MHLISLVLKGHKISRAILSFLLLSLLILQNSCQQQEGNLHVTHFGATQKVSGSMTLITYQDFDLLIDAGLYYPEGEGSYEERSDEAARLNTTIPFKASDIEAVAITHSHLDHIGRLPLLVEKGFKGDLFATEGSLQLMHVMLASQIRYDDGPREWIYSTKSVKGNNNDRYATAHWNFCEWQNKISNSNKRHYHGRRSESIDQIGIDLSPCKVCTQKALSELLSKINIHLLQYGEEYSLDSQKTIMLLNAAHIPGSASVYITINNQEGVSKRLLFSGDVGKSKNVLHDGFNPAPQADLIWIENTYGGIVRDLDLGSEIIRFQNQLAEALYNGGIAWIPAFALDRTQQVLYLIQDAKQKNIIPENTKVFVPSPSASDFTDIYLDELDNKLGWFKEQVYNQEYPFAYQERYFPDEIPESSIIITTSGMMESVFSSNLLDKLLPNKSTTVFTVGYQGPGTPGGQLRDENTEITWDGEVIPVEAKHLRYSFLSGHADANEMQDWLSNQNKDEAILYLMHGEKELLLKQKDMLEIAGFDSVFIPTYSQTIQINMK